MHLSFWKNLIEQYFQILGMYRINHFSCYLYLGSILVDIYGTEDGYKTGLIEMMQVLTNIIKFSIQFWLVLKNVSFKKEFTKEAFDFIIKNCSDVENINELRKHPDTIDDFFRLSLRFLQRCPFESIESPIFTPIMTLAVTSLNLDHRDANLSVTKFLSEFVALSHKPQIDVIFIFC